MFDTLIWTVMRYGDSGVGKRKSAGEVLKRCLG